MTKELKTKEEYQAAIERLDNLHFTDERTDDEDDEVLLLSRLTEEYELKYIDNKE